MKLLYTPCKDEQEATKIAHALVKERLVACANLFPIKSIFSWKEQTRTEKEVVLLVKTTDENESRVREKILKLHSYDVPCVLSFSTHANASFEEWVTKQVR